MKCIAIGLAIVILLVFLVIAASVMAALLGFADKDGDNGQIYIKRSETEHKTTNNSRKQWL